MTPHYEYLVVGKGLIGAAALRYLSCASHDVAAIGPDEPADTSTHQGVFSSHYDQGRIVTQLSRDETWAKLVARATAQYAYLEEAGGARFYQPLGMLHVVPQATASLQTMAHLAAKMGVAYIELSSTTWAARLPQLRLPCGFCGFMEECPAGIINPRSMLQNQLTIAGSNGAGIICETVVAVQKLSAHWKLTDTHGRHYTADNVLLSAGAYTNCFDLLRRKLDLRVKSETTILFQISSAESDRLGGMPPVSYLIGSTSISDVYIAPPLRYPDGNYYIKLGANTDADMILPDLPAIQQWMIAGCNAPRSDMEVAIHDLLPGLNSLSVRVKRCLVTYSAHSKPYIDQLDDGLFVATAGNGAGAACSDTLGCMAADLMLGRVWPVEYDRADFRQVLQVEPNQNKKIGSSR